MRDCIDKKKIAKMAVLAGVFMTVAVLAVCFFKEKSPQWRLTKGLINLGRELSLYQNPVLTEADILSLWQKTQNGGTHTVAEIEVNMPGRGVSTVELKLDNSTDRQNRLLKTKGDIYLFEKKEINLEIAMDADNLYLTLPALSSKALRMDAEKLKNFFNNSLISKIVGWSIPEDYLKILFGDFLEEDSRTVYGLLGGAFLAGTLGEKSEWSENSFREMDWDGYTLTLPSETVNQLFTKLGHILGREKVVRFEDQLTLEFYLDKKGRIIRITTPEALTDLETGSKIAFAMDFLGEERTIDEITMTIYVTEVLNTKEMEEKEVTLYWSGIPEENGSSGTLLIEWIPSEKDSIPSEAGSMKLTYTWDYLQKAFILTGEEQRKGKNLQCEMRGTLLNVIPGEYVQINVESLKVFKEKKEFCSVAGILMLEPLKEKITMPESVGW